MIIVLPLLKFLNLPDLSLPQPLTGTTAHPWFQGPIHCVRYKHLHLQAFAASVHQPMGCTVDFDFSARLKQLFGLQSANSHNLEHACDAVVLSRYLLGITLDEMLP